MPRDIGSRVVGGQPGPTNLNPSAENALLRQQGGVTLVVEDSDDETYTWNGIDEPPHLLVGNNNQSSSMVLPTKAPQEASDGVVVVNLNQELGSRELDEPSEDTGSSQQFFISGSDEHEGEKMLQVTVPEGCSPGGILHVQSTNGQMVQVTLPPNAVPGSIIQIADPAAVVQAQVLGAPQQMSMGMGGQAWQADIFQNQPKILIRQEFALIEMCGIEAKNRYRISVPQPDGRSEGQVFLYISETSDCFERICCSVNRSLTLNVHAGPGKDFPIIQQMEKPFHLQGCICCRPTFNVTGASKEEKFGRIEDPWRCCVMDQQIFDVAGALKFVTSGSLFQCGLCCPLCADIDFTVSKQGKPVGHIKKLRIDPCECVKETNRFLIDFQGLTDPTERRLALASAMLLDLQYFEQNKNNNN